MKEMINRIFTGAAIAVLVVSGAVFGDVSIAMASDVPVDIEVVVNESFHGMQVSPRVALLDNENIFVVWVSKVGDKLEIKGKIINQEGDVVKPEFTLTKRIIPFGFGIDLNSSKYLEDDHVHYNITNLSLFEDGNSGIIVHWAINWEEDWTIATVVTGAWMKYYAGYAKHFDIDGKIDGEPYETYKIDGGQAYGSDGFNTATMQKITDNSILVNFANNTCPWGKYGCTPHKQRIWSCVIMFDGGHSDNMDTICTQQDNSYTSPTTIPAPDTGSYHVISECKDNREISRSLNVPISLSSGRILLSWNQLPCGKDVKTREMGMIIDNNGQIIRDKFVLDMQDYEDQIVGEIKNQDQTLTLDNGTTLNVSGGDDIIAKITGTLKDECVTSPNSTNLDWGWNWAQNASCQFVTDDNDTSTSTDDTATTTDDTATSTDDTTDDNALICMATMASYYNGGWGWNGVGGCKMDWDDDADDTDDSTDDDADDDNTDTQTTCEATADSASNGGWGWDGVGGCKLELDDGTDDDAVVNTCEATVDSATNGGWGWDAVAGSGCKL